MTPEKLPPVLEASAEESERMELRFALRDAQHDSEHLAARLERAEADRDRLAGLLDHATRFTFSDLPADDIDGHTWTVSAEPRRGGMWVVVHRGFYLGVDGWTTNRNRACQYDRDTAIRLAEQHSHTVVVNGMTAADLLARKTGKEQT